MHIGIAGPLSTRDIKHLLCGDTAGLPCEMVGATLLVALIEELLKAGHQVTAFTTDPSLVPFRTNRKSAKGHNFSVYYVPRRRHSLRFDRGARGRMLDLFALERHALADAMQEVSPQIVHAHWSYEFAAAAIASGLPYVVTCHDSPWAILKLHRDLYRLGRLLMAKYVLSRAKHLTVVSPYLISQLNSFTNVVPAVVPNAVPAYLFAEGAPRTGRDYNARPPQLVMLLNGWSIRKNPQPGMAAMKGIRLAFPDAVMHLYGPDYGPGEKAEQWATSHNIKDAFVFHGATPHQETMRGLAQADLLIHPAVEESFGMTIIEAMALGVPVVAGKNSGAVPWVLGNGDGGGILTDINSSEKIAESITKILSSNILYSELSSRGYARAKKTFSAGQVARGYIEQYETVLNIYHDIPHGRNI